METPNGDRLESTGYGFKFQLLITISSPDLTSLFCKHLAVVSHWDPKCYNERRQR